MCVYEKDCVLRKAVYRTARLRQQNQKGITKQDYYEQRRRWFDTIFTDSLYLPNPMKNSLLSIATSENHSPTELCSVESKK